MPLKFHPDRGSILICDYNSGFIVPEMVKRRPVVVVSPRYRKSYRLCTVVPLSTTAPGSIEPYHCEIEIKPPLPGRWGSKCWAKCDMIATVSFSRLELVRDGKDLLGNRRYYEATLPKEVMEQISECVQNALGMK